MASIWKQIALLALPVTLVAPVACAQTSQADLKASYEAKLSEDWFVNGGWSADYDAVRAKAKEEGKLILAYFSRTYSP